MAIWWPTSGKAEVLCPSSGYGGGETAAIRLVRYLFLLLCFGTVLIASQGRAFAETRTLKIYHVHTGEKAIITYKRNGRYIPAGLKKLDYILRDWRKDKEIAMDPRMMDLLWEVYQKSGSHDYIHIICGYRTGDTNAMLRGRSRSTGVAKASQHILGKAVDFYIPDVPLEKLREIGMKFQVGGVGYYPNSGSPFVHMDTGFVRAWPRMSRGQLVRLFPNGHTLHLPRTGNPLPGYQEALASYKRRVTDGSIMVAGGSVAKSRSSGNLLAALFGNGREEADDDQLDAGDTVQAKPSLRRIETAAMAPVDTADVTASSAALLPKSSNIPIPGMRPVEVASAAPAAGALLPAAEAGQSPTQQAPSEPLPGKPHYADLVALAAPVPELPPRDVGAASQSSQASAEMAVLAEADVSPSTTGAVAPRPGVPVPGSRPELVAYADLPNEAQPAALAMQMRTTAPARHVAPARPSMNSEDVAASIRRKLTKGQIIVASLAPTPSERPNELPAAASSMHFRSVKAREIRGGRLGEAAGSRGRRAALTKDAIANWAKARRAAAIRATAARVADARRSRVMPATSAPDATTTGDFDPKRFAAVADYFPKND